MTLPTSLRPSLTAALTDKGYDALTDVQGAVLDAEAEGRDLLVSAQTGSGKTVAFGLAMAPELLGEDDVLPAPGAPMALVIAPTRELALQVQRELAGCTPRRAGAWRPASAAWMRARSAGRWSAAPISWWARRAACATIWNAARWTCRSCPLRSSMKPTKCLISALRKTWNSSSTPRRTSAAPCCFPPLSPSRSLSWRAGLSARRPAHLHHRGHRPACRHHLSCPPGARPRAGKRRHQRAALSLSAARFGLLRHARSGEPAGGPAA
jgi:hypothetical protein